MKRYIALALMLVTLCGCASNAPAPTVVTETTAQTTAATIFPTEETAEPTQPETTAPIITGFDPMQLIASMTLEEKVGQLFLARCPGANAIEQLQKYHLGGYILFAPDTKGQTKESLAATIAAYQEASAIPMLIAVMKKAERYAASVTCPLSGIANSPLQGISTTKAVWS